MDMAHQSPLRLASYLRYHFENQPRKSEKNFNRILSEGTKGPAWWELPSSSTHIHRTHAKPDEQDHRQKFLKVVEKVWKTE